ncbi:MAG TPA: 50S ribosomal protein L17 [Firmicutes bacterium]|nr:50S ribosomal protein L17 [Bacillota bacterium]
MRQRKLGRMQGHRRALLRSLVTAVVLNGRITTTEAKAKSIKPLVDQMVTLGKRGDLHARRQAASFLTKPEAVEKLFETIAPKYEERNGGYTRVLKLEPRRGDAAPMALIELV